MEALYDLLFELSNEDRLKILLELEKGPKNLTRIAKNLNFTAQGTSRNVARLLQTSLITRNLEGDYIITPYGSVSLKLLSAYKFLSENKQYFLTHDSSVLPYHLVNRYGELSVSSFQGDFVTAYAIAEVMMNQAKEYIYSMGVQVRTDAPTIVAEKLKLGVEFRTILPVTIVPPPGYRPPAGVNRRMLPKVQIRVQMTEKKAIFGLPTLEGKIDYEIFVSEDPKFHKWCLDLFNYYWDQGKPLVGAFPNLT